MTNTPSGHPANLPPERPHQPAPRPRSKWDRLALPLQFALSLAVAGGVLVYLIWSGMHAPSGEGQRPKLPEEVVQEAGPLSIRVKPGTPLDTKLHIATVQASWLTAPVLPVTGASLASLRSDPLIFVRTIGLLVSPRGTDPFAAACQLVTGGSNDSWQFATADLLTAFSDWQKAVVDAQFQKTQLAAVRELAEYRVAAQKEVVQRMEKLVKAGTHTVKDLMVERVNLKTFEIQGKKEIHEAENVLKVALKTEATLARQLQQAGLEPTMLRSAAAQGEIVVAEVPERVVGRVRLGMTCAVKFFALPERLFTGQVSAIAPAISKEKRVLNVQFIVKDPDHVVRPGMFAEVGLGTDKRRGLLMPADGVLHVEDKDYALQETKPGLWKVAPVQIGELHGTDVEVLAGLQAGDRVLGKGAMLLKPVVVRVLQSAEPSSAVVMRDNSMGRQQ